jgi:hypothetical protein
MVALIHVAKEVAVLGEMQFCLFGRRKLQLIKETILKGS